MAVTAAGTAAHSDVHSFRLAHPVIHSSSRMEITAFALLSMFAMALWLVVVPLEFALHLTVSAV